MAQISYLERWKHESYIDRKFIVFKRAISKMEEIFIREIAVSIKKYSFKGKVRILDLGCGDGNLSLNLVKKVGINEFKYVGIDCNKNILKSHIFYNESKLNHDIHLIYADVNHFKNFNSFDIILALHSLYGVSYKKITDLINWVKFGGLFLILMNSRKGLFCKLSRRACFSYTTAEDLFEFLREKNINFTKKDLHFKLSRASTQREINWIRYLIKDKKIDERMLNFYNQNREQIDYFISIKRKSKNEEN